MVAIVTGNGAGLTGTSLNTLGTDGQLGTATTGRGGEAVYINAKTGSLILQHQDELLIGLGPDIELTRTYNSNASIDFDNNDSWQLSFYRKLENYIEGSTVQYVGADGTRLTFAYDGSTGAYINKNGRGAYNTLTFNSGSNTWNYTNGNTQHTETFTETLTPGEWRVTELTDLDGNALTYDYDSNDLISQVTDANNEVTKLNYDAATKRLMGVETVTKDGNTTCVRYTYDARGRLTSVSTDLTPTDNSINDGNTYTTTYTYDGGSNRIASIINRDGTRVNFIYDINRRITNVIDGEGKRTNFTYDTTTNTTTISDPLGQTNTLTYDNDGNLTRLQGPTGSGQDILYAYDVDGNLRQTTDSRGHIVTYTPDDRGNVLRQQDAAGNVIERTYNNANRLTSQTVFNITDPDGVDYPLQASAPQTTNYIYDANQHLRFVITPEGRVTEHRYNLVGQQITTITYSEATYTPPGITPPEETDLINWTELQNKTLLQRSDTDYDARGMVSRLTRYTDTDLSGEGISTNGTHQTTQFTYDSAGRLLQKIDARGSASATNNDFLTSYAYDGMGRTISVIEYDAIGSSVGNGSTRLTQTNFNDALNRTEVTLANGLKRITTFDKRGQISKQVELEGSSVLTTQNYRYDAKGRISISTDGNGNKTYYLYDIADRKVGEIDATHALTEFIYNNNGQLTRSIRYHTKVDVNIPALFVTRNGIVDHVDISNVRPTSGSGGSPVDRWIYDAAGRLRFAIDALGYVTESRYDGAGRLLTKLAYANPIDNLAGLDMLGREAQPDDLQLLTTPPGIEEIGLQLDPDFDRVSRYIYDNDGLLRATLDGEGYLTEYTYDAAGRQLRTDRYAGSIEISLRADGDLDSLRATASVEPNAETKNIRDIVYYNGLGQIVRTLNGEGYLTAYRYDLSGNLIETTRYAQKLIINGDAMTNTPPQILASTPTNIPAEGFILTSDRDQTRGSTWTANNQIETETAIDGTITRYIYDISGNQLQTIVAEAAADRRDKHARYDLQGRLVQELSATGAQALTALGAEPTQTQIDDIWITYSISHTYDAGGRRTKTTDANGNWTLFYYDAAGRLTQSINTLGEVKERSFNALGQLEKEITYSERIPVETLATLIGGSKDQLTGILALLANPTDSITRTEYTLRGEIQKIFDPLNNDTTWNYNAFRQTTESSQKTQANNTRLRTLNVYDKRGLITSSTADTDVANVLTVQIYDAFGRLIQKQDGNRQTWTQNYDRLGRIVTTIDPNNTSRVTTYDAFDRILTQQDGNEQVTTTSYDDLNRTIRVTTPENITLVTVKNRYGETQTFTDGRSNVTTYDYDQDGRQTLITQTNSLDPKTRKVYNAAGQLIESSNANNQKTIYTYDAAGRLQSSTIEPNGLNLRTEYRYDAKGQNTWIRDAKGIWTKNEFNLKGELETITIDPKRSPEWVNGADDNPEGLNLRTQYEFDARGKTVTVIEGAGTTKPKVAKYTYDQLGRRTIEQIDPYGSLNLTTHYEYDDNNNLIVKTNAAGQLTRYVYDDANRLIYTIDPLGGIIKLDYDAEGRESTRTTYANPIDLTGLPNAASIGDIESRLTLDTTADHIQRSIYDRDGRLTYTIDAHNFVTHRVLDAAGNVTATRTHKTAITTPATWTLNDVSSAVATVADANIDRIERNIYDAAGRLTFHINAGGYVTENQYDKIGNLVRTILYANPLVGTLSNGDAPKIVNSIPGSGAYVLRNSTADQSNAFIYDTIGRLISSTDALGFSESYQYDAVGNKTAFTNKKGSTWTYKYNANRQLEEEISPQVDITKIDQNTFAPTSTKASLVTRIEYDALGNVKTHTEGYGQTNARTTTYVYDAVGRQTRIIHPAVKIYNADADAAIINNGFNGTEVIRTETVNEVPLEVNVTYDAMGRAVVNKDVAGVYSYKVYNAIGQVKYEIDAEHYLTEYTYDRFGNVTHTTRYANALSFAFDRLAEFTEDEVNTLKITSSADRVLINEYDNLNRLITVTEPAVYTYDPDAPTEEAKYFTAGRITKNTYNAFGQVTRQSVLKNAVANTWTHTYFYYDTHGNKTAQVDALGYLTTWEYDETGDVTRQVEYAQALTSWSLSGYGTPSPSTPATAPGNPLGYDRETRYGYDQLNRRISETRVKVETSTNRDLIPNQPPPRRDINNTPGITTAFADQTTRFAYDAVGNLVCTTDALGASSYIYYNALGHKVALAQPERETTELAGRLMMPAIKAQFDITNGLSKVYFDKTVGSETTVKFAYKVAGSSQWYPEVTPSEIGNQYVVSLPQTVHSDRYDYEIRYFKQGESATYATGAGTFNLVGPTSLAATHVVTVIEEQQTWSAKVNATAHYDNSGDNAYWVMTNSATLTWNSLAQYGDGNIEVELTYNPIDPGSSQPNPRTYTLGFTSAAADRGVDFEWEERNAPNTAEAPYGISSVQGIKVFKYIDNVRVTVLDSTKISGRRLILRGNTTNLTSIDVTNVGRFSTTQLGGGVYAVDLAGFARGTYTFTPNGTPSSGSGSFNVQTGNGISTGKVGLQEAENQLVAYNLPANTQTVTFQYRLIGDTGPNLAITLNKNADGSFSAGYDQISTGKYRFELTAKDNYNNPIDLSSFGGNPKGLEGEISILHDQDSIPNVTTNANATAHKIPLTELKLDIYGNIVKQIDYINGASNPNQADYDLIGGNAQDKKSYYFYDSHGRIIRSVDAMGNSKYSSYDAYGNVIKEWQPYKDADGLNNNAIRMFEYDRLGRQVATVDPTYITNPVLEYSNYRPVADARTLLFTNTKINNVARIQINWGDLSSWGQGDVKCHIEFKLDGLYPMDYTIDSAGETGATLDIGLGVYSGVTVGRIEVFKKDAAGNWVRLHDRYASGAYGQEITLIKPAPSGVWAKLRYRPETSGGWNENILTDFGDRWRFNFSSQNLTAGATYQYEVEYYRTGDTIPYDKATGTFVPNGYEASVSVGTDTRRHVRNTASYNAFGEVEHKSVYQGKFLLKDEYFEFDHSGRIWRTNSGNGVNKVNLYNLDGHATAEIKSQTLDLRSGAYLAPDDIAKLDQNILDQHIIRTDTHFDALGRVRKQERPSFKISQDIEAIATPLTLLPGTVAVAVQPGSPYLGSANRDNSVTISWGDLDQQAWGNDAAKIQIDYVTTIGTSLSHVEEFSATDNKSKTFSWSCNSFNVIGSVTRILVLSANGNSIPLYDSANPVSLGSFVNWARPIQQGVTPQFQYKLQSETDWRRPPAPVIDMGGQLFVDTRSMTAGTYDWELLYTRLSETNPYAHTLGTLTLGANADITQVAIPSNTTPVEITPGLSQTPDRWGNVITSTSARGNVTHLRYNDRNQLIEQIQPLVATTDAKGVTTDTTPILRTFYDANGQTIGNIDANGNSNTIRYNPAGQITAEYHADGGVVRNGYDVFNRKTRSVDTAGNVTDFFYDSNDHIVKEKRPIGEDNYEYDALGNRIVFTNALNQQTSYFFDARGKLIKSRTPGGEETIITYDALGDKVRELNANGDYQTWNYDGFGHLIRHTDLKTTLSSYVNYHDSRDLKNTEVGGTAFAYTYNFNGQLSSQTNTKGLELSYTYYENGDLKEIRDTAPSAPELVTNGSVTIIENTDNGIGISSDSPNKWDNSSATSNIGYAGSAYLSGTLGRPESDTHPGDGLGGLGDLEGIFGLNTDPTPKDEKIGAIDYGWYHASNGDLYIYESGVEKKWVCGLGEFKNTDLLKILYDGTTVSYWKNDERVYQTNVSAGRTFYFDSSLSRNFVMRNLQFTSKPAKTFYEYDADGNRTLEYYTRGDHVFQYIQSDYDSLGRITTANNINSTLTYSYDAVGNRRSTHATYSDEHGNPTPVVNWYAYDAMNRTTISQGALLNGTIQIDTTNKKGFALAYDANGNRRQATTINSEGFISTEAYTYDANNRLISTYKDGKDLTSQRSYDLVGRVTDQISNGKDYERRHTVYNANGLMTQQDIYNNNNTLTQQIRYTNYDNVGNLMNYEMQVMGYGGFTNHYTYTYSKFDSYKETYVGGGSNVFLAGTTRTSYDNKGNIFIVNDLKNPEKSYSFISNQSGQILQKLLNSNGETQHYYYANGNAIGSNGALSKADFDFNYTPISAQFPATTPGNYIVSSGDTLQSIALALFGDAQRWYLIADANSLRSDADLAPGMTLIIPNKVTNLRNAADTFKPYAPGQIIGDTTPTLPTPPPPPAANNKGCSAEQIIVAAVVVAVSIYTMGVLTATYGLSNPFIIGAISGMAGNVAGQLTAMKLNIQDKFSWKAVAVAGISGGVTHGINGGASTSPLQAVTNTVTSNVITQGISVAIGLQEEFQWRQVATAAITASITQGIRSTDLGEAIHNDFFGGVTIDTAAKGIAYRRVYHGKPDWRNIAADSFGNAVGNSVVGGATAVENSGQYLRVPNYAERNDLEFDDYGDYRGPANHAETNDLVFDDYGDYRGPAESAAVPLPAAPNYGQLGSGTYGLDAPNGSTDFLLTDPTKPTPRTVRAGDYGTAARGGFDGLAGAILGDGASAGERREFALRMMSANPGVRYNRITSDTMLTLPGSDSAISERALAGWAQSNSDIAARADAPRTDYVPAVGVRVPIDPVDGLRVGPTVERALNPNWILRFESNASLAGHVALGTELTVLGAAKYNALGILQRAAPLLNNKQYLVGVAETLGDAAAVFKSPTGATAQSLAWASTRYGGALRSLGYVGTAANIAEETAFVVRSSENGFNYKALGASATNVTGDAFATLGGIKIGAALGALVVPLAPITIPLGAAAGGFAGHYGWDTQAKPFYRELWTGVPEPKE